MVDTKYNEQVFTNCTSGGPVRVYVKEGKIVRMEPWNLNQAKADGLSKPEAVNFLRLISPEYLLIQLRKGHGYTAAIVY
jgi:hypothetical protein